jgi:hypothetical protein
MVLPINDDDSDRCIGQQLGRGEAAKAGADDDDLGAPPCRALVRCW